MFVLKKNIQIEQESITFNTSKDVFGPPFFTFNSCMDKLFVDFGCERRIYVISHPTFQNSIKSFHKVIQVGIFILFELSQLKCSTNLKRYTFFT
jgi:hypothetical protein